MYAKGRPLSGGGGGEGRGLSANAFWGKYEKGEKVTKEGIKE